MNIIHLVSALNEEASGPTYSVSRLASSLSELGNSVNIGTLDFGSKKEYLPIVHRFPIGIGSGKLGGSPKLYNWLDEKCKKESISIIHNHGLWQMNSLYSASICRKYGISFIQSPRGSLSNWAMNSGSKLKPIFWKLMQRSALEKVACFHATSEGEYLDIRRLGFRQPVAIIPNGIDVKNLKTFIPSNDRILLFLGRIHPIKGLDMLLSAWKGIEEDIYFNRWKLKIVGTDEGNNVRKGYLDHLKKMAKDLELFRIDFVGPLYGANKMQAFSDAELFVLPSYSENFAVSVAESLSVGTPAIVSKGAPWQGLVTCNAGWWIDIGVESLRKALVEAMSYSSNELVYKGKLGYLWMKNEFSWNRIAEEMLLTYQWVKHRDAQKPNWVHLD